MNIGRLEDQRTDEGEVCCPPAWCGIGLHVRLGPLGYVIMRAGTEAEVDDEVAIYLVRSIKSV